MEMWFILLVGLVGQGLATQVNYQSSASAQSSSSASSNQQQWSWQEDQAGSASNQQDSFQPSSFSASDAVPQQSQQSQQVEQERHDVYELGTSGNDQISDSLSEQSVESVIDDILVSNRQGRNLDGFDEVYADPNVQNALQLGNDTIARTYIRDKLCSLGLMNCDNAEGRRPFYSPHRDIQPQEIIYAQPVTIKPVGRPLPAIPVKRPYGPPRPVPFPPGFGSRPPSPIYSRPPHSGPNHGSHPPFSGPPPSFSGPPPSFNGPYAGYKKPGYIHGSKPVYEGGIDGEVDYEDKYIDKKQMVLGQGSGVQQHVHHHYVHGDDVGNKEPIILGGTTGALSNNGYGYGNGADFEDYKKAFNTKKPSSGNNLLGAATDNYANRYPVYEKPKQTSFFNGEKQVETGKQLNSGFGSNNNFASGNGFNTNGLASNGFGSNGLGSNGFGSNGFGSNGFVSNGLGPNGLGPNGLGPNGVGPNGLGSNGFGSNNFGSSNNNFGSSSNNFGSNSNNFGSSSNNFGSNNNNFGSSNGFENGLGSNSYDDCVCVPYDQCTTLNQAGRKDDLYLAIDPRNLGKDIEAETAVVTDGNNTMTVVRITKEVNEAEQHEETKDLKDETTKEEKERTKRDVKHLDAKGKQPEAESRLLSGNLDTSKLNLKPTWGVSFGLPQSGGGNYPINPYGEQSLINPYPGYGAGGYGHGGYGAGGYGPGGYGAGGQGINLGLVSVNPLVAVQVTKDDYGEKVIKPFVNLHVTPNQGLVNKFGNILQNKKQALFGGYQGNYAPQYYPSGNPTYVDRPGHFYPSQPHYPNYGPAHYEKPYQHHHEHHHYHQQKPYRPTHHGGYGYPGYYNREENDYDDDNFGEYGDYNDGYYRNARANISAERNRAFDPQIEDNNQQPEHYNQGFKNNQGVRNNQGNAGFGDGKVSFPSRKKREVEERQFGRPPVCGPSHVCCRKANIIGRPGRPGQCGTRNGQGINGRIKNPVYVDGDSEFGEYPWQVAILKKDPSESVYVCGGTLISPRHILTAAHCVKTHAGRDLRARLGEWDVNHDVEFFPYIERDVVSVYVHPEFYAGTLYNDLAILKLDQDVNFEKNPHISPACLPQKFEDFTGTRCWTTGWGKDAFGDFGKYQNILKEVDVPVVSNPVCEQQMRRTRLGPSFNLHPGFICAGGEEGKDACKGDGGGPMVCERQGKWQLAGVVSWGIGCGKAGVPGVYSRVSYYLDWINQVVDQY